MEKFKFYIALIIGKIVAFLVNIVAKGRGTNLSGKIAYKISPNFIKHFRKIDYDKVVFITGTNGKSTTNNMIINALKTAGKTVATNEEGANLITGIATAMIKNSTLTGKIKPEYMIFETDERYLKQIYNQLPAKKICITNIQKDQVQRNGEPDFIYEKIKSVLNNDITVFINNEEPRAKSFEDMGGKPIYYGIERNDKSFEKNSFYDITLPCPKCNDKIKFQYYNIDNVGKFQCTNCGFSSEREIKYFAKDINYRTKTFMCDNVRYTMNYTEPFFLYNYALCIAICKSFGIPEEKIKESFITFKNIGGRLETINYKDKEIKYIRIKQENPETLQSALNYVAQDKTKKILIIGLEELKELKPPYTNTFYGFDCDYDELVNSNIHKYICFAEAVAYDSANILVYAGVNKNRIKILPTEKIEDMLEELDNYDLQNVYLITWLHAYEALERYMKKLHRKEEKEQKKAQKMEQKQEVKK